MSSTGDANVIISQGQDVSNRVHRLIVRILQSDTESYEMVQTCAHEYPILESIVTHSRTSEKMNFEVELRSSFVGRLKEVLHWVVEYHVWRAGRGH